MVCAKRVLRYRLILVIITCNTCRMYYSKLEKRQQTEQKSFLWALRYQRMRKTLEQSSTYFALEN